MPKRRGKDKKVRKYKKALFIVCEGGKTEPNYFDQLIADCNFCGKPVRVEVIDVKENTAKELAKIASGLREIPQDEVWAVFDKDGYTKHHEAFDIAKSNNVNIAFSSISFEFWVLLHFEYTTRPFNKSEELIKYMEKKSYFDEYDKSDKDIYQKIKGKIRTYFKLTEASFKVLRDAKLSEDCLKPLQALKQQTFDTEDEFLSVVTDKIGKVQMAAWKPLLLRCAKINNVIENAQKIRKVQFEANPGTEIYKVNPYTDVDRLVIAIDELNDLY